MNHLYFTLATTLLVYRAYTRSSLTTPGILAAILTATAHAQHSSPLPFTLLITFYTLGTVATKTKANIKSTLTVSSTHGAPVAARTAVQVFANSIVASTLVLLSVYSELGDVAVVGVIAHYAAVTADTLSSELGILSRTPPILITTLKPCPKGTNGGVSATGLLAGAAGAAVIGVVSAVMLPWSDKVRLVVFSTVVGTLGSLLDSLLGAVAQESVVDVRSGRIVEAHGGGKVLVGGGGSRKVLAGRGWLSNNGVNFVMALSAAVGGMVGWKMLGV